MQVSVRCLAHGKHLHPCLLLQRQVLVGERNDIEDIQVIILLWIVGSEQQQFQIYYLMHIKVVELQRLCQLHASALLLLLLLLLFTLLCLSFKTDC